MGFWHKDTVKLLIRINNHKIIYLKRKFVLLSWSDSPLMGIFPIILQRYSIMLTCMYALYVYYISCFVVFIDILCGKKSLFYFLRMNFLVELDVQKCYTFRVMVFFCSLQCYTFWLKLQLRPGGFSIQIQFFVEKMY